MGNNHVKVYFYPNYNNLQIIWKIRWNKFRHNICVLFARFEGSKIL